MVTGCVIRKCSSVWSPISFTSYHCFPLKNPEMLAKWMKAIPPGYITIPNHSSRICSRHFLDDCFTYSQNGKRSLKKDAVPTLFGSDARKEDILSTSEIKSEPKDSDDSCDDEGQKVYRYVKRSKYLHPQMPNEKHYDTGMKVKSPKKLIQTRRNTRISKKEIELKKQIIMLKIRQLRRENQIQSMTKVVNSFKTIVKTENLPDN